MHRFMLSRKRQAYFLQKFDRNTHWHGLCSRCAIQKLQQRCKKTTRRSQHACWRPGLARHPHKRSSLQTLDRQRPNRYKPLRLPRHSPVRVLNTGRPDLKKDGFRSCSQTSTRSDWMEEGMVQGANRPRHDSSACGRKEIANTLIGKPCLLRPSSAHGLSHNHRLSFCRAEWSYFRFQYQKPPFAPFPSDAAST